MLQSCRKLQKKGDLIPLNMSMYVHSVYHILHNVHLQTSIHYHPFLEDSRKTLVTTSKLIVKP